MEPIITSDARSAWTAIVFQTDRKLFSEHFDPQATLTASVLEKVLRGGDEIYGYFEATRAMFESFAFNSEVAGAGLTFLTWEGTAFKETLTGVTVLERGPTGLVTKVEIYSGPLSALTPFAVELKRRINS